MQRRDLVGMGLASSVFPALLSPCALASKPAPKRVAIVIAGDYDRYDGLFESFVYDLCVHGILVDSRPRHMFNIERHFSILQTYPLKGLWETIAKYNVSEHLRFLPDAFYNYRYDKLTAKKQLRSLLTRLQVQGDIDLILAFGTQPCSDLLAHVDSIPVLTLDCPAADSLGLIDTLRKNNRENMHFRLEHRGIYRQIEFFQRFFKFKKLGMVYARQRMKRSHVEKVRAACKHMGINLTLASYNEQRSDQGIILSFDQAFSQIRKLVEGGVQALYFSYVGADERQFHDLIYYLIERRIPTFSQVGADQVRRGFLLGMSDKTLQEYGEYEAWVLRRILNGEKPGQIPFEVETALRVSLNLKTALLMGLSLHQIQLLRVDETFTEHYTEKGEIL